MRAEPRINWTAIVVLCMLIAGCGGAVEGSDSTAAVTVPGDTTTTTSTLPTTTSVPSTTTTSSPVVEPEVHVDPEGNPVDYLTYGAGAFPVRFDPDTQRDAAAAILDGREGYSALSASPTGPEEPLIVIVELPAPTTFKRFAIPPMSSFGCCSNTHIDTVRVEGSAESPDAGFQLLAEFRIEPEIFDARQEFGVDLEVPVRWVRVTLAGRQVPDPDDYRGTTFTELLGFGTQDPIVTADGTFSGIWLTGGGGSGANSNRIELIQDGALVTGCIVSGGAVYTLSGGIDNGLLRYLVEGDVVPVVAVVSSEDQLVGATIGRSYGRLIGTPGGDPTSCSPGPEAPPNPIGEALDECRVTVLYGINFDVNRDEIRPDAEPALQQVLDALTDRPIVAVVIEGHTDSDGSDAHNLDLSQRRANSVVAWLVANGVGADRLTALGKGETEPIASNETSAGKAANRRVEVEPDC